MVVKNSGTCPEVIAVPLPSVEKIIPDIKYAAGILVFFIKKPPTIENISNNTNSNSCITEPVLISGLPVLPLLKVTMIKGVIRVSVKTLVDWITDILVVSALISELILSTKLRCPGAEARIEDFLSIEKISFSKY